MNRKFISLLLALLIVMTAAVACVTPDDKNDGEGTTPVTGDDGYNENLSALENAMAQYNANDLASLHGKEFVILSPDPGAHFYYITSSTENEIYYEEPSSEPLSNAIYNRNSKIYDKLGVTIKPMWGGSTTDITNLMNIANAAGDTDFNLVLTAMHYEMTYATNGQLYNIYDIPTINVENRWWDQNIVNTFTIYGNRLFVLTGDINYYDDYSVQAVLFNKSILDEYGFEYPYQDVRDGTWTIDKMTSMASVIKREVNGDDVWTPGVDLLGLADDMDCVLHFLYPFGLSMSTVNSSGEPEVVWPNDENTAAVEKIVDIFSSDYVSRDTNGNINHFRNGKIAFYCSLLGSLPGLRDMETDFGVVPIPKADESMEGYKAYMSNGWSTSAAIPSTLSSDMAYETGIMVECISAASQDIMTPALYDQLLESRFIRDPESKEMLSYVFASKVYDWAGDLDWAISLRKVYQNLCDTGAASFARQMSKIQKPVETSLKNLCDSLRGK